MAVIRATAQDIAKLAGVSQTTVSLVLNDVPNARISKDVRRRVREVAKERELNNCPVAWAFLRSGGLGIML